MPVFHVYVEEQMTSSVSVEAENEQEAIEKVEAGNYEMEDQSDRESQDMKIISVDCDDE